MSRRRRRRSSPPPVLFAAVLAALAAAGAAVARRSAGGGGGGAGQLPGRVTRAAQGALGRLPGPLGGGSRPGQADWRCACGAKYRVSGLDRHRVYWPAGAGEGEPVVGTECVSCGRPLPA